MSCVSKTQKNQRSNCQHPWITEKEREFQENISFCFIDYTKAFDCVDHSKLWEILKETRIPDYLSCLLRNLYAGQEATVKNQTSPSASLTTLMPLTVWITANCGKFWKRQEYPITLAVSWEICMQVKKQQLKTKHGTMDWFKIGKGVHQGYMF